VDAFRQSEVTAMLTSVRNKMAVYQLLSRLREVDRLPLRIEFGRLADNFIATLCDPDTAQIMSLQAYTGLSRNQDTALLKALMEYVERAARRSSGEAESSNGFAAFPTALRRRSQAARTARLNAYHEAFERYVWARWWDEPKFEHLAQALEPEASPALKGFDRVIRKAVDVDRYVRIVPTVTASPGREGHPALVIVLAFLRGGGVLSGGAAGPAAAAGDVAYRAFSELARHALGLERFVRDQLKARSFYERRLVYFGTGEGDKIVDARLQANGRAPIVVPTLSHDCEVTHRYRDIAVVHRCLFADQPPFVGGALERLCL
jgi:hypothetical protein